MQTRSNIVCVLLRRVFVVLRDVKSNHTRYRDTQINITVLIRDPHNTTLYESASVPRQETLFSTQNRLRNAPSWL